MMSAVPIDVAARRWLAHLDATAPAARTWADGGDPWALEHLLEHAFDAVPEAAPLREASERSALATAEPRLAEEVRRSLEAPWAREAALRARLARATVTLAGASEPLGRALARLTSGDADERAVAEAAVAEALEVDGPALARLARSFAEDEAPGAPAPAEPPASPLARAGSLFVPSAEIIAAVASGLGGLETLLAPPPPAPDVKAPAPAGSPELLGELCRALAESLGGVPASWTGWLALWAGRSFADFRVQPPRLLERVGHARALPFRQPAVPLTRAGALVHDGAEADRSFAHLLGAGAAWGHPELGAAWALTAGTAPFVRRGLLSEPAHPVRPRRCWVLAAAGLAMKAALAEEAAGDPVMLGKGLGRAFGAAPGAELRAVYAAEHGLARAPGEGAAIYGFGGAPVLEVLERGARLAEALRERFDEDWFRNPRATLDVLVECAASVLAVRAEVGARLLPWLRTAAAL